MTNPLPSSLPPKGLPDKTYNALKLAATILLPALQVFYVSMAALWHWGYQTEISGTIAALNVLAGGAVKFSQMLHEASGAGYSGTIQLEDNEDGTGMRIVSLDPNALLTKPVVSFRVAQPPPSE